MKAVPAPDYGSGLATACGHNSPCHHRRRRHVVGRRGAAGGASGIRRAARAKCRWRSRSPWLVFAAGGVVMGRLLDRAGIVPVRSVSAPLASQSVMSAPPMPAASSMYALAHAVIGFGSSLTLGPLMADISHWFVRRRGVAVTLCSAGNYFAGTMWPPIVQHLIAHYRLAQRRIPASACPAARRSC